MGAVNNYQFAIGNGVTTAFTLQDPSMDTAVAPTVTALYRTDWQGKQLLYTTARTNVQTFSRDQTQWIGRTGILSAIGVVGLDGVSNSAYNWIPDTTFSTHRFNCPAFGTALTNLATYTYSEDVKANGYSRYGLRENGAAGYATFDLVNGIVLDQGNGATGTITPGAQPGWYFITMTFTAGVATTLVQNVILPIAYTTGDPITFGNWVGDGVSGLIVQDCQVEAGAVATSRIIAGAASTSNTDYVVAGAVATLTPAPLAGSTLAWTGTDNNGPFIPGQDGAQFSASFGAMGVR